MKSILISIICLSLFSVASGQTFYYLNDLISTPTIKSDTDTIKLTLSGDYSDPGSYINSITAISTGTTVDLTVDCAHKPGAWPAVIVPFDTTITLGIYSAGSYHINVQGTSLGVFIQDTNKFNFIVNPGSPNALHPKEQLKKQFKIYPNPANSSLFVRSALDHYNFHILDMAGKAILKKNISKKIVQFDLSMFPKGIYLIQFFGLDNSLIKSDKLHIQ